jgi:large subunit ribosomal protein L17
MRHRNTVKKLNRPKNERVLMIRNLLKSLVENESIVTTESRYKVVRSSFDKLVNTAKKNEELLAMRRIFAVLRSKELSRKVVEDLAKRHEKTSGYLNAYKLDNRKGDNAKMVKVQISK